MPNVLILIYSTLFGASAQGQIPTLIMATSRSTSEPWLFLFGFGRLTMLGRVQLVIAHPNMVTGQARNRCLSGMYDVIGNWPTWACSLALAS